MRQVSKVLKYSLLLACTICVIGLLFTPRLLQIRSTQVGFRRFYDHYKPVDSYDTTCLELAQDFPEPYTAEYFPVGNVDTSGPVWSFHQYEGNITLEDLKSADKTYKHPLVWIKIIGGKVYYREQGLLNRLRVGLEFRKNSFMSGLLMTLAWFDVPDLDMLLEADDFLTPPGGPIFQFCGNNLTGSMLDGFTVPWAHTVQRSLGPTQMKVMSQCLDRRYPPEDRIPKVVWRGKSRYAEGRNHPGGPVGVREKAIMAGWHLKNYTDFAATSYFGKPPKQCASWVNVTEDRTCPPTANYIPLEDSNKYALVLDVDGRAWSERFSYLLSGNTPIIKQRTRYPDYLTPHLGESMIKFIEPDMSDIEDQIKDILHERNKSPLSFHEDRVKQMREFARAHLSHFGIARATAYVLTQYARKLTWIPKVEIGFTQFTSSDMVIHSLPNKFMDRILSRD